MRRPVGSGLFGGRLADCCYLDLSVAAVNEVSPRLRSITFESPDLVGFEWQPGQDIMFDVPGTGSVGRRRYTIRRADSVAGTADVEVVLHGHGPFGNWAAAAAPGDRIEGIGPRGAQLLQPDAAHHLFVADESAVPAAMAMLEGLPAGASGTAVCVTDDGAPTCPADGDVQWLNAGELAGALAATPLPDGTVAYVNGERALVRDAVAVLQGRGLERIASKAYWRRDRANAAHGEPPHD